MSIRISALRRYPVKSMGGEALERATLDDRGIEGDRMLAVRDVDGRFASGKSTRRFRRYDGVFELSAATDRTGVTVSSRGGRWRVGDPRLDAALREHLGVDATVVEEGSTPHQDGGAVSLVGTATLAWCAGAWGIDADPRRLRVNVVVATEEPFVEERWIGTLLDVGTSRLRVVERIPRCRTVDLDQDGAVARGAWLSRLARERDMRLAVYADVVRPGSLSIGDEVVMAPQR